jgi:selenocysteine lyase/cysteine desulfurase
MAGTAGVGGVTVAGALGRPGLRLSPHFYNSVAEIERVVAAVRKYLASGVQRAWIPSRLAGRLTVRP